MGMPVANAAAGQPTECSTAWGVPHASWPPPGPRQDNCPGFAVGREACSGASLR